MKEAKEELLSIGSSRHDDIVDAMAYAEQILTPSYYLSEQAKCEKDDEDRSLSGGYGIDY
jgi:hypothetical protein